MHDGARGGDVDLMLEVDSPVSEPAQLSATLAARVSRTMFGCKVNVLIKAPNLLLLPIHDVALAQGVRLKIFSSILCGIEQLVSRRIRPTCSGQAAAHNVVW